MKKFKLNVQSYICILLCLILYITVLPLSVSAQEDRSKVVRVGWYEGTYNTTGPDGQRRGYSYEYQQAVAVHTGWKYEYVEGSWAELMSMLKNGQIDLLGGISYTEERSTSMLFSELPMGEDRYYLYVNPSNTDISASNLTTLNEKRIGMMPDTLSTEMFQAIEHLVRGFKEGNQFETLLGVTGSGKTFTMANVIQQLNKPTLILAHNKTLAVQLYGEMKEFFPENAVEYFVS